MQTDRLLNTHEKLLGTRYLAWILMILSIIIWYRMQGTINPGQLGNTSNIYRMGLVSLGGLSALVLVLKYSKNLSTGVQLPLALLLMYGFAALFSSLLVPSNALYTMWKSAEVIIDVVAMIGILAASRSISGPIAAYRWLMVYNSIMILLVLLGALLVPSEALRPSRGLIPFFLQGHIPILNPNTVGFISVQLVIHNLGSFFRSESSKKKTIAAIMGLISVLALILAQSRTSFVGLVAGLVVYLFLDKKRIHAAILVVFSSIILLFTSGAEILSTYLLRGQSDELVTTLSGRTHGWTAAWELFMQAPFTGHGFAAAARTEILGSQQASTLHGAFFDVIVGVGLMGLAPWLLAIVLTLFAMFQLTIKLKKWAITPILRSWHAEFSAITVMLVIRSITSSGIAMHEHAFMLLICIMAYCYIAKKSLRFTLTNPTIRQ